MNIWGPERCNWYFCKTSFIAGYFRVFFRDLFQRERILVRNLNPNYWRKGWNSLQNLIYDFQAGEKRLINYVIVRAFENYSFVFLPNCHKLVNSLKFKTMAGQILTKLWKKSFNYMRLKTFESGKIYEFSEDNN